MNSASLEKLRNGIRDVHDFPKPGIVFKDIAPILGDPELWEIATEALIETAHGQRIDKVVGIDARGFIFGAVVAAFVPMILAFVAIILAIAVAFLISQLFPVSIFITNIILMIGLALGIDYTLFIVERFREERALGREKLAAIEVAGDTASRAVLFSGMVVVISLLGMLIVPTNIFRALGGGAIMFAVGRYGV